MVYRGRVKRLGEEGEGRESEEPGRTPPDEVSRGEKAEVGGGKG